MRASGWAAWAAVCALAWGLGSEAEARSFRGSQYPNGNGCNDCHQAYPGDPNLTSFGRQVWDNLAGANVDWPALVDLDADGDGFSNGEELGDADAVYPSGALQQRKSDPFDAGSVPVPLGNPPTAAAISLSGMEDVPLTGTLMGAANDPNDVRYFRIVTPPATGEVVELNRRTGAFRYVPEPNAFGAISFEYRLFDGQQLSPVVRASLDLASVNDLPTITGPSERQVLQGEALTFVVTAQDVEDGRLTVSAPTPLPAGASFDAGSGTFSWATTREQVGEHELRFAARDQGGAEAALVVTVNVTLNNAAPSLGQVEWEGTAAEGDALTLRAPATDEDGDVLTWTWDLGDGSPPQVTQGDTLEHLYAQDGSYAVSVTVSDGMREDTSSATLQITNLPPVPEAGPDLEGVVGEALGFAGSFTDLGAQDEHTILWDFGDGTQEPNAALTTSHAYAAPGVYTVTFAVSDELERARDTLTVTIREGAGTNNASTNNANNANNASANNSGANNSGVGGNNASANNSGEANNGDGGGEPTVGDGGCQSAPRGAGLGGLWWAALGAAWAWRRGRRLGAR